MTKWNLSKDTELHSAETITALKDFCFWTAGPLIIFLSLNFLSLLLTVFLAFTNEIKLSNINFIQGFYLPQLTLVLIFSIFIPYLVYKMLKPSFHYNLSFFFLGSAAFMQGVILLYLLQAFSNIGQPQIQGPEFLWAYAVLFLFLYFIFMILSSVFENFKEAKKETKPKDKTKIGIMIISSLIFIACLIFVVQFDYQLIREGALLGTAYAFLPSLLFLYAFYKLLFKSKVTGRQFVYLPASVFICMTGAMVITVILITAAGALLPLDHAPYSYYTLTNMTRWVICNAISCFLYIATIKQISKGVKKS